MVDEQDVRLVVTDSLQDQATAHLYDFRARDLQGASLIPVDADLLQRWQLHVVDTGWHGEFVHNRRARHQENRKIVEAIGQDTNQCHATPQMAQPQRVVGVDHQSCPGVERYCTGH